MSIDTEPRTHPTAEALAPDLPTVVVDPRFRARRIAVRKDAGRRRLKRLLVLIAVALVALATVIVLRSPILDVDTIEVHGASTLDPQEIRELTGIHRGQPLLLADLHGAEAALRQLPWVASVDVRRDPPGAIVVDLVERRPVAVVSGGGRAVLVDDQGVVLGDAPASADPPYVHVIVDEAPPGPGVSVLGTGATGAARESRSDLGVAIDLASRLRANPAGVVTAVHLGDGIQLQLLDGAVVDLGDERTLDDKVEAFRTVYARVDQTCVQRIDLRVPTHPVLTRRDGCS